jgi:polar amino acid transport system substrate-binding protein
MSGLDKKGKNGKVNIIPIIIVLLSIVFLVFIFSAEQAISPSGEITMTKHEREYDSSYLDKEKIVLVTNVYPPYIFDEESANQGFFINVIEEAFAAVELEVEIQRMPWSRCTDLVDSGYAWGAFPYVINEEREKEYVFSAPIYETTDRDTVLFYNKNVEGLESNSIEDLSELKEFRVGGVEGYWYLTKLEEHKIKPYLSADETNLFQQLSAGSIEVVPANIDIGRYIILYNEDIEKKDIGILNYAWEEEYDDYRFMLDKENSEYDWFNEKLEEGMEIIKDNGIYDQLVEDLEALLEY